MDAHNNQTVTNSMNPSTHRFIVIVPKKIYISDPEGFMFRHRDSTTEEEYHLYVSTRTSNKKSEQLVQDVKKISIWRKLIVTKQ